MQLPSRENVYQPVVKSMFLSDLWYTIGNSERMERATFTTTLTTFCKSLEKVRTSDDLWLFIESTMKSMPKWSKDEYVKTVFKWCLNSVLMTIQ